MKKIMLVILMMFGLVSTAYGAGIVETVQSKNNLSVASFAWTTSVTGSYTITSEQPVNGYILMIETVPDATAVPNANYDVSVKNADGLEIVGGTNLFNRSATATEAVMPLLNSEIVEMPNLGKLTVSVVDGGTGGQGIIRVYYRRDR